MGDSPIRRGQLITPFGVGALYVAKDGEGIITAGLDHWYKKQGGETISDDDLEEFVIKNEWRLEKQLGVNHFRLPPDFRTSYANFGNSNNDPNTNISIPFLRFPRWHFCSFCRKMNKVSLAKRGQVICDDCTKKIRNKSKNTFYSKEMIQVPIVAVCENGHIQDFPWNEWVHRTANPSCSGNKLKFISKGTPGLMGMAVRCEENGPGCNSTERSLAGVLNGKREGTEYRTQLSLRLTSDDTSFLCQGHSTWNGDTEGDNCSAHLKGSLRSSSNIYYSKIESSIFVPIENNNTMDQLIELFNKSKTRSIIGIMLDTTGEVPLNIFRSGDLKKIYEKFSDEDIKKSLDKHLGKNEGDNVNDELDDMEFRRDEFNMFNREVNFDKIETKIPPLEKYNPIIKKYFNKITLVKKLTETRALYGFTRVDTDRNLTRRQHKEALWKNKPDFKDDWLPAIQVSGEGIFFNFNEEKLKEFESNKDILDRITKWSQIERFRFETQKATPRYILLHTFAHIMINTFIYECGYGAASLQERIYISDGPNNMAGVLIYTAAGDSEGTMGGLVRMGHPDYLERIVEKAIESSKWCSVDPVCMEVAENGGQGPDSLNLGACHNCALVPETSCEAFNSYLDRAMLTGTVENKKMGYFN